jgi:hypothetical protein
MSGGPGAETRGCSCSRALFVQNVLGLQLKSYFRQTVVHAPAFYNYKGKSTDACTAHSIHVAGAMSMLPRDRMLEFQVSHAASSWTPLGLLCIGLTSFHTARDVKVVVNHDTTHASLTVESGLQT